MSHFPSSCRRTGIAVTSDPAGRILVAARDELYELSDVEPPAWRRLPIALPAGIEITSVAADRRGLLWLGTTQGVLGWRRDAYGDHPLQGPAGSVSSVRSDRQQNLTAAAIRVAIVEDQRRLREGLAALIDQSPGLTTAGSLGSMEEALAGLRRAAPDVALVDINLPGISGIEGLPKLKEIQPGLQILMLTVLADDDHIVEAICMGAAGYLLKDTPPARIVSAVREVCAGGSPMTPDIARKVVTLFRTISTPRVESNLSDREIEVLDLFAEGHTYRSAAAALSISPDTIRFHIRNIYGKLQVNSKSEAVLKAFRAGLLRQR